MSASLQFGRFAVPLPEEWEDGSQLVLLGPPEAGFRPNFLVARLPVEKGENARQFALRQLPELRESLPDFTLVKEGDTRIGNRGGFLREHSFGAPDRRYVQLHYYFVHLDDGFMLS